MYIVWGIFGTRCNFLPFKCLSDGWVIWAGPVKGSAPVFKEKTQLECWENSRETWGLRYGVWGGLKG